MSSLLFSSETDQLAAVAGVLQNQSQAVAAIAQRLHDALAQDAAETLPFRAEIDQVILPDLQTLQQELAHSAAEWANLLRRVQQMEPLLAELTRRIETRVTGSAEQIVHQSDSMLANLMAAMKPPTTPAVQPQEAEDDHTAE